MFVVEEEMSHQEVYGWFEYLGRRPYGWQEDQRTAMLVNAFGAKKRPEELFPSLKQLKAAEAKAKPATDPGASFLQRLGKAAPDIDFSRWNQ